MKTLLILAALVCATTSHSSTQNTSQTVVFEASKPLTVTKKGNVYSFEIAMDASEADAILERLPAEIEEIEKATRKKSKVSLTFKEDAPEDRINKALMYTASLFGNGEFEVVD